MSLPPEFPELAYRVADLGEICSRLEGAHYRLVWVVGGTSSARSALLREFVASGGNKLLELGKELSAALIDVAASLRAASIEDCFSELLDRSPASILCLDHLEILFETSLRLNPVELLKNSSRHRPLVASWPGSAQGDRIAFAPEEHPSHRKYFRQEMECQFLQL